MKEYDGTSKKNYSCALCEKSIFEKSLSFDGFNKWHETKFNVN